MKIVVDPKKLLKAAKIVAANIPAKPYIPIAEYMYMTIHGERLIMSSTNLSNTNYLFF